MAYDYTTLFTKPEEQVLNPSFPMGQMVTNPMVAGQAAPVGAPVATQTPTGTQAQVRLQSQQQAGINLPPTGIGSTQTRQPSRMYGIEQLNLPQAPTQTQGPLLQPMENKPFASLGSAESPIVKTGEVKQTGGQGSGSFTNLNAYLEANRGLNFGAQVAGQAQREIERAAEQQNVAERGFRQAADIGTIQRQDELLRQIQENPIAVAQNEAQRAELQRMRDAAYGGPRSLAETEFYQPTYEATRRAQEVAGLTESEAGRKTYLQELYGPKAGRYDYTPGMQRLDNLLLQRDPEAKAAFAAVQANAANLPGRFEQLNQALNQYAQRAGEITAATRGATRGFLGIGETGAYEPGKGIIGQEAGQLESDVARRQKELADIKNLLGNIGTYRSISQFTPEQLAATGITPEAYRGYGIQAGLTPYYPGDPNAVSMAQQLEWINRPAFRSNVGPYQAGESLRRIFNPLELEAGQLYGANPASYASFANEADITASSVASPEQLARLQALSNLAGIEQTFISAPEQVGKLTTGPLYQYDPNALASAAGGQQELLRRELKSLYDQPQYRGLRQFGPLNYVSEGQVGTAADPTVALINQANRLRAQYGLAPVSAELGTERVPVAPIAPINAPVYLPPAQQAPPAPVMTEPPTYITGPSIGFGGARGGGVRSRR
jgi:hypothetical protein